MQRLVNQAAKKHLAKCYKSELLQLTETDGGYSLPEVRGEININRVASLLDILNTLDFDEQYSRESAAAK